MKRAFRYISWIVVVLLLATGLWKLNDFAKIVTGGRWVDEYPNKTRLLSEATQAGPGIYDLFLVYGDLSAICISFVGVDPRQLAANKLNKDLIKLQGSQPFFTSEGVVSIISFDRNDQFKIEEFHKDDIFFFGGSISENTCIDHPSIARVTIENTKNAYTLAKLTAKIDLK